LGVASSRAVQPQASVWLAERSEPARRTAPAGLDRARIVAAAVRLLDSEGLDRFSMRRLAAELGVSAMSVYWYVDNKDDLLELALDAVSGEARLPDLAAGNDWRDDIRQLATEFRRVLVAHPWAPRLMGEYLNVGPNAVAFSRTALLVMDRSGIPRTLAPGALAATHQFALGFATVEGRWIELCREAGLNQDELFRTITDSLVGRPGFEEGETIMRDRVSTGVAEVRERDFAFALDCVIAGIDAMARRWRAEHGAPPDGTPEGESGTS
jgi:AcrR family transcriptional regulator